MQSNFDKGEVKKLSYRSQGPFCIIKALEGNDFEVQNWLNDSGAKQKYKANKLYLLPASFLPRKPLDILNQSYQSR